jgi:transcriptional regulator with XRE-family HTH domain
MTPDTLREIITASGLTNSDAARQLGMDPRHMRRLLSGQVPVTSRLADDARRLLAPATAGPPEWLTGRAGDGRRWIARLHAPRFVMALAAPFAVHWLDARPVDAGRWIDAARAAAGLPPL